MKKEEIYVLIDSEEKRLRAIQILTDAGENIHSNTELKQLNEEFLYMNNNIKTWVLMYGKSVELKQPITLDQLEEMLMPKKEAQPIKGESYIYVGECGNAFRSGINYPCVRDGILKTEFGADHGFDSDFFSKNFVKVEIEQKSTPELTFPREMLVWKTNGCKIKKTISGIFCGKYLCLMGDNNYFAYDFAEEIPSFETEVQKLAESFGVKVNELKYESKK